MLTPYTSHVEPFVWWQGAFTESELNWLQQQAVNAEIRASVGSKTGGETNENIRRSNVSWLQSSSDTKWLFDKLAHVVSSLNEQYYRFDLRGFGEALQLTNYNDVDSGMYTWHQDYGAAGISRKLSVVVQLTDPAQYDGGNLQVFTGLEPCNIRKEKGLIAVFPSYTLHQVTPVTRGSRQSLVSWITGPSFK